MGIHGAESMHRPRLRVYHCEACHDTACECSTEGDIPPTRCTMQCIPHWREASE